MYSVERAGIFVLISFEEGVSGAGVKPRVSYIQVRQVFVHGATPSAFYSCKKWGC